MEAWNDSDALILYLVLAMKSNQNRARPFHFAINIF